MKTKQPRVVITGAGGFIGGNLSNYLSNKYKIFSLYNSKLKVKLKRKIITKKQDLKNIKNIEKGAKVLIHCASVVPPHNSQIACFKSNTLMDSALIKAIQKSEIKKIIFMSIVSVYGKNIKVIILRLSTVVGKKCHSTFLSRLSENIFKNKKISIYNPKSYYNSCIHITNLNSIVEKIIRVKQKRKFGIINIHSEKPVEIRFIYDLFKKKLNKKIKFNIINSKKKSYILQSKSAKKYNLRFTSTRSNLEKFISDLK